MEVPPEAFDKIIRELERLPLRTNDYRLIAGSGKSQAFGVVNKRCLPPDYSRQCWKRPELYYYLLEFGKKYVPIEFNAITVNQNYQAAKHYDKNNNGNSYLVAFGDFTGGELLIHEGDLSGNHNICYKPIIADFSKILHSVAPFKGKRYSLVYYKFMNKRLTELPPPSVRIEDGKYVFYRGNERIDPKVGLPHPLKKKIEEEVDGFSSEEEAPDPTQQSQTLFFSIPFENVRGL
jgi:hypothetical protein